MRQIICILSAIALTSLAAAELPDKASPSSSVLTSSAIIEIYQSTVFQGIVLIQRGKEPFGYALPGGKVEGGESIEDSLCRRAKKEVNLEMKELAQFHVYSDPKRDPRCVEVAFLAKATELPQAGDDAASAGVFRLDQIPWDSLMFDHAQILRDYLKGRLIHDPFKSAFRPPA